MQGFFVLIRVSVLEQARGVRIRFGILLGHGLVGVNHAVPKKPTANNDKRLTLERKITPLLPCSETFMGELSEH